MPERVTIRGAKDVTFKLFKKIDLHDSFIHATIEDALKHTTARRFELLRKFSKITPIRIRDNKIDHAVALLKDQRQKLATRGWNFSVEKIVAIAEINAEIDALTDIKRIHIDRHKAQKQHQV